MPLPIVYVVSLAAAYFVGAIPTGYLVARRYRNVDILHVGSGRTGTTNILRALGWKAAGVVFLGDLVKGMIPVAIARLISGGDPIVEVAAGLTAVLGHTYSVFIHFKGGRGVVTGVGALAVISPIAAVIGISTALVTMALSRYASLGSIVGACSAPVTLAVLVVAFREDPVRLAYGVLGALFIVVTHKDNIRRLLSGTERKLGERVRA